MRTLPLLVLWLLPLPLLGQSNKRNDRTAPVARPSIPIDSAQHREGKEWQPVFGLGQVSPFFGLRARMSRFWDKDSLAFIEASGGQASTSNPFPGLSNQVTEGRKFSVGYKQFLGNSFYIEGSVFQRSTFRKVDTYPNEYHFSSKVFGVDLLIGNQWQWNRFTLGCDWVGAHVPVSAYGESYENSDGTEFYNKKLKDYKNFARNVQPILAGFYLGFSF